MAKSRFPDRASASQAADRFRTSKDGLRKRLLKYSRRAFRLLPPLTRPRLLDVGCGNGIPTLELARLSRGQVVALDRDPVLLEEVVRKAAQAGLSDRIAVVRASIPEMEFAPSSFDIVWAEGSIDAVGFRRGLEDWKVFLKPRGFLVVHDEKGDVDRKLSDISACDYQLIRWFVIDRAAWRRNYFAPLARLARDTKARCGREPEVARIVRQARREIDWFRMNPGRSSSFPGDKKALTRGRSSQVAVGPRPGD
jgi:SAM-dependent methyltransferase